jgi:hypothetical protein
MASYVTFMNTWSEAGVSSEVIDCTVEEAEKTAPGVLGREAAESTASSAEFGWGKHLVFPKDVSDLPINQAID